MKDKDKTKKQLINELEEMRQKVTELKAIETEHEFAEKELRQTKEYLDNIIESSLDSIVVTDSKGYIARVNRFFLKLTGNREDEVIGKHIAAFSPPKEGIYKTTTGELVQINQEFFNAIAIRSSSLIENGKIPLWETYLIRKDKKLVPVEENIVYLFDSEHNIIGAVGSIRDITKRKKVEKEFIKVRDSLKNKVIEMSIINDISEVLLSTRKLNEILHMILIGATSYHGLGFNRAFLFLINKEKHILEGKIATGSLSAEEAYKIWSQLKPASHTLKEILKSRHGELSKEDAPINELVKQMQIPLKGTETVFTHAVFKQKSYNIINGKHNRFVDNAFLRILGTDSFALVPLVARGKTLGVLLADNFVNRKAISDEDVKRLRAFANHASLAIENSHLYKSVEEKVEELSSAYNELKKNRDKLLRYERLSAVGEMAAKVAHDIRNPLTAVGGFARRILKTDQGRALNKKYMKIIVKEIDRLEKILGDLLCFTAPAVPDFNTADLNSIIKSTFEILDLEIEQNNIILKEQLDPHLPQLLIDENQIRRVLNNIIKNAIEAMPEGGTITVSTAVEGQLVKTEVHDTGVGISDNDIGKLFDPFFTSKSTGSGLGLTLSAQIIRNHGGTIEVRKAEHKGTIFTLKLPVKTLPG